MKAIQLIIQGHVQGVYFRKFVETEALKLNLKGYVKNNPDGSVEAVAQGPEEKLQQLKMKCYKGPENASVENIIESEIQLQKFTTFSINY